MPDLGPEHIVKHAYNAGDHCHCLLGWAKHVCGDDGSAYSPNAKCAWLVQALSEGLPPGISPAHAVSYFNDNVSRTRAAEHWNRTMERLGYTEVED